MNITYASQTNPAVRVVHSPDGAAEIRTLRSWLAYTEHLNLPHCKRYGIDVHNMSGTDALSLALELAYLSGKIHTNETL